MIIPRYLGKEVLLTWLTATGVLMLIFLSTQFVHYLTGAAIGRYAAALLAKIMMYQVPILLGLLIPVGFYGALLLAYGRFYADREMIVLNCCGYGVGQLIRHTLIFAVAVCFVTALFSLWLSPWAAATQQKLIDEAKTAPVIETLLPGRFFATPDGRYVLFVDEISSDHTKLRKLFLAEKLVPKSGAPAAWSIVTAEAGQQVIQPNKEKYLMINNGFRYQGVPGAPNFEIVKFEKYGFQLENKGENHLKQNPQQMNLIKLWHDRGKSPEIAAELQWRFASPISVFILALLAIPLSQVNPRQGRFAKILPAAMIYILYANMMFVTRSWVSDGTIPTSLGLWWLHGLLLVLALILIFEQENGWIRFKKRFL